MKNAGKRSKRPATYTSEHVYKLSLSNLYGIVLTVVVASASSAPYNPYDPCASYTIIRAPMCMMGGWDYVTAYTDHMASYSSADLVIHTIMQYHALSYNFMIIHCCSYCMHHAQTKFCIKMI